MIFPLIAVGLFFIWIGFVVVEMLGGKLSWPGQQASNLTAFFNSHRITTTLFIICIAFAAWGHYRTHEKFSLGEFAEDFYGNYFSEIIGIGATVFLIDRINRLRDQQREEKSEKDKLSAEMGSMSNDVALLALKKIRQYGWLENGSLVGLDLSKASLGGANLFGANLRGSDFTGADLVGADFTLANLVGADLSNTNLRGAHLVDADLSNANLYKANLTSAYLKKANLRGASLYSVHLNKASLAQVNLVGADLNSANLRGASLVGADLSNADLTDADLTEAKLIGARYNKDTILPDGFDVDGSGAIRI